MTTQVTVRTHDHPAYVRQIVPAAFDGEAEVAERRALAVEVPAGCEMVFYAHSGMDLLVTGNEPRPVLDDEWFATATAHRGEAE